MNNHAEMQDGGIGDPNRCEVVGDTPVFLETEEAYTSFTGTYRKSIAPVMSLFEDLIRRCVWVGHPIETHPLATEHEMSSLLAILRTSSPLVGDKLQLDTSSINTHLCSQKVLNNYTRGIAYMRQYFKLPLSLVTLPCDCIACACGLFLPWVCHWMHTRRYFLCRFIFLNSLHLPAFPVTFITCLWRRQC